MTDRTLFPLGPALGNLSARQEIVFELLQAFPSGVRAIEAGNYLHRVKTNPCLYCSEERTCQYASRDANDILRSLSRPTEANPRGRGLAIHRKSGLWQSLAPVPVGERDLGELPENF